MELAEIITGAIALTALIISGIVAYRAHFSRFNVKIYCGNPRLEPVATEEKRGGPAISFCPILPLYFINTGAKGGVIRNIVTIVKTDRKKWLSQSVVYTPYNLQRTSPFGQRLTEDPANELFYPIQLQGKSSIYKSIGFMPLETDGFPTDKNPLLAGKYTFEIKVLLAHKKHFETKLVFSINLQQSQINSLSNGDRLIPFLEEVSETLLQLQ